MKSVGCEPLPVESPARFLSTLELVVSGHETKPEQNALFPKSSWELPPATAVGRLTGFSDDGVPLVEVAGSPAAEAVRARTTVALPRANVGSDVVVCFAGGDWRQPIVLGLIQEPQTLAIEPSPIELNGQRLELSAQEEIVLRCGKSSITLTKAGKVLIRGEYLLSRSAGVNRIKGGSVQIN